MCELLFLTYRKRILYTKYSYLPRSLVNIFICAYSLPQYYYYVIMLERSISVTEISSVRSNQKYRYIRTCLPVDKK